jgi:hypothetical protein
MIRKTRENDFLQNFGYEGKVRDRTVVAKIVRVKGWFFKERSDKSRLEEGRENTRRKGEIDDVSDWNSNNRKKRFNKESGDRVKRRSSRRGRFDEGRDFVSSRKKER